MNAISTNDPGLSGVNRRSLLLAGPAALAGVALPGAAAAAALTPSPVMALFKEWQAYSGWLSSDLTKDMAEEEFDAAVDVRIEMENRMMAEPARDVTDVLAKMTAYADFGEGEVMSKSHLPQVWAEAREFIGAQA